MPRPYKHWGSVEEDDLVEMVGEKTRDEDIALSLGRSVSSVQGKRRAMRKGRHGGVNLRKVGENRCPQKRSEDRRLEVIRLMQQDLSFMDLARALGLAASSLTRLLRRMVRDGLVTYTPPPKNPYRLVDTDLDMERTAEEHELMEKLQFAMSGKKRARKD